MSDASLGRFSSGRKLDSGEWSDVCVAYAHVLVLETAAAVGYLKLVGGWRKTKCQ